MPRALYLFEREDGKVWDYYSLTATGEGANRLVAGHPRSHIKRAVAIYRYAAGLAPDGAAPAPGSWWTDPPHRRVLGVRGPYRSVKLEPSFGDVAASM